MCRYLTKKELKMPKKIFIDWVLNVQKEIKENYSIHFNFTPIGSGKRNMVVWQCNRDAFDLDYQIELTRLPDEIQGKLSEKAKEIKLLFKDTFDKYRPEDFKCCEDSTQALTTLNTKQHFGYDIIITYKDESGRHILFNKKNSNDANNNDYWWAPKTEMNNHRENYLKVVKSEHRNELKDLYLEKRHKHKDDVEPQKKKSYQILNESVNEIITKHNIK